MYKIFKIGLNVSANVCVYIQYTMHHKPVGVTKFTPLPFFLLPPSNSFPMAAEWPLGPGMTLNCLHRVIFYRILVRMTLAVEVP